MRDTSDIPVVKNLREGDNLLFLVLTIQISTLPLTISQHGVLVQFLH